jgi:hypothetical protein
MKLVENVWTMELQCERNKFCGMPNNNKWCRRGINNRSREEYSGVCEAYFTKKGGEDETEGETILL